MSEVAMQINQRLMRKVEKNLCVIIIMFDAVRCFEQILARYDESLWKSWLHRSTVDRVDMPPSLITVRVRRCSLLWLHILQQESIYIITERKRSTCTRFPNMSDGSLNYTFYRVSARAWTMHRDRSRASCQMENDFPFLCLPGLMSLWLWFWFRAGFFHKFIPQ